MIYCGSFKSCPNKAQNMEKGVGRREQGEGGRVVGIGQSQYILPARIAGRANDQMYILGWANGQKLFMLIYIT